MEQSRIHDQIAVVEKNLVEKQESYEKAFADLQLYWEACQSINAVSQNPIDCNKMSSVRT